MNPLTKFCLHLADDALILGHRNSEWCGHGPVLEQDIAITNISLDLIGQSRNFFQLAAEIINSSNTESNQATEDSLAYLRDSGEFRNSLLLELPRGDWAFTILRQYLFSSYQFILYGEMQNGSHQQLAAIAAKALKEVNYHLRWSSEWVIRLGDGTEESHQRMNKAISEIWPYCPELFRPADYEQWAASEKICPELTLLKSKWESDLQTVFSEAGLSVPQKTPGQSGGKEGKHSDHLDQLLNEMQHMQRTYPGAIW